jgi:hypothetical protein
MTLGRYAAAICMLLLAIARLAGCAPQHVAPKIIILPSGEQIVIIDVHGDEFTDVSGHKRHIYYVGYQSSHNMDAISSLRAEARRVFALYLPQIIGLGYDTCVVTPMRQTVGGDEEGRPYYFTSQPSGQWSLAP